MLSLFPHLLNYELLAPFIIRLVAGFVILDLGYLKLTKEKRAWLMLFDVIRFKPTHFFVTLTALAEIVAGILFITGFLTQAAALVMAIILSAEAYLEYRDDKLVRRDIVFYILLLTLCVSLLFTGAGAFAFDLPL